MAPHKIARTQFRATLQSAAHGTASRLLTRALHSAHLLFGSSLESCFTLSEKSAILKADPAPSIVSDSITVPRPSRKEDHAMGLLAQTVQPRSDENGGRRSTVLATGAHENLYLIWCRPEVTPGLLGNVSQLMWSVVTCPQHSACSTRQSNPLSRALHPSCCSTPQDDGIPLLPRSCHVHSNSCSKLGRRASDTGQRQAGTTAGVRPGRRVLRGVWCDVRTWPS